MAHFIGQGPTGAPGPTSVVYTTPFPCRPGERIRDLDGNEYVFCDFTASVSGGILVSINERHEATPLLGTALLASRVGVAMTGATSANGGWVQIYGTHRAVQGNSASDGLVSDGTVAYYLIPQTSVSTPSGTLSLVAREAGTSVEATSSYNRIYNMWLSDLGTVSDFTWYDSDQGEADAATYSSDTSGPSTGTTATTNGTSMHTGVTWVVFLNYPYVLGITQNEPLHNATS